MSACSCASLHCVLHASAAFVRARLWGYLHGDDALAWTTAPRQQLRSPLQYLTRTLRVLLLRSPVLRGAAAHEAFSSGGLPSDELSDADEAAAGAGDHDHDDDGDRDVDELLAAAADMVRKRTGSPLLVTPLLCKCRGAMWCAL